MFPCPKRVGRERQVRDVTWTSVRTGRQKGTRTNSRSRWNVQGCGSSVDLPLVYKTKFRAQVLMLTVLRLRKPRDLGLLYVSLGFKGLWDVTSRRRVGRRDRGGCTLSSPTDYNGTLFIVLGFTWGTTVGVLFVTLSLLRSPKRDLLQYIENKCSYLRLKVRSSL